MSVAMLLAGFVVGCSSGDERADTATAPGPPERIAVPDLVGLNPEQARTRLCAADLSVGAVEVVARSAEVGRRPGRTVAAAGVRASRPAAGETVDRGASVELDIAAPGLAVIAMRTTC
ncbi:MAG: PASTA domain-containing protein [Thermoleophilia bacterium]